MATDKQVIEQKQQSEGLLNIMEKLSKPDEVDAYCLGMLLAIGNRMLLKHGSRYAFNAFQAVADSVLAFELPKGP